jgi:hypothetical protein
MKRTATVHGQTTVLDFPAVDLDETMEMEIRSLMEM